MTFPRLLAKAVPSLLRRLATDVRAATAVEYGLILALIVLAMMAALKSTAASTISMWGNVSNKVEAERPTS